MLSVFVIKGDKTKLNPADKVYRYIGFLWIIEIWDCFKACAWANTL